MSRCEFLTRREILRAFTVLGAGAALAPRSLLAQSVDALTAPDLIAIKGGEPGAMFDKGIEAFGGMKTFVKKGMTVVIKPNATWNQPPESAANTNPELVGRVVEHSLNAGAKRVYVVDNTIDNWELSYKNSGIRAAVEEAGGKIVPAHSERYYQEVNIPNAKILKSAKVHEVILEADLFINIPILKHHGSTKVTAANKNLMGVVWDRWYYHRAGLNQCIADFPIFRKPDLNIVDAYNVLMSGGPRGSSSSARSSVKKAQLISTDIVAIDAAAIKIWNPTLDLSAVPYIKMAEEHNLGTGSLEKLNIKRISM